MSKLYYIFSIIVVILGWWAGHHFASRRDIANKRREQRISYLITSFSDLNRLRSFSSDLSEDEVISLLLNISNNIELFGNTKQIKLFRCLAKEITENAGRMKSIHCLINDLRVDIRKMLQFENISEDVSLFTIEKIN
jgi:hypothetical protein